MSNESGNVSCGRDISVCPDLNMCLKETDESAYEFICIDIVNPHRLHTSHGRPRFSQALSRSDMLLNSGDWSRRVVAKLNSSVDVDSKRERRRLNDEKILTTELNFASHLGVPSVLITLKTMNCENLARMINIHLTKNTSQSIWIKVPLIANELSITNVFDVASRTILEEQFAKMELNPWKWWNKFRILCNTAKNLSVVLELTADLPDNLEVQRWIGEPVKALIISTDLFISNQKGFPVLTKTHQAFVKRMFKYNVQIIITGPNLYEEKCDRIYQQYMNHLFRSLLPSEKIAEFCVGYEDFLQCPLQPLMDNLESQTYEVFEKDPIKYELYEEAINACLKDKVKDDPSRNLLLMVLGAGRGPLMTCSIRAAKNLDITNIKFIVIEKNPNAINTLLNMNSDKWNNKVEILTGDMRSDEFKSRFKGTADVIVSELLGSFGDNELSPECLDGAQYLLKANGTSIPKNYTSFIAPISSCKLWDGARVLSLNQEKKMAAFETPYVVKLHQMDEFSPPKQLFYFEHPNNQDNCNNRYTQLDFSVNKDTLMHGFSGYFECELYNDIMMSILPSTHSKNMFSWFPIYLPIKEPIQLKAGNLLKVHFWRKNDGKNVWYEYCVTEPETKPIHNPNGRSYTIGL